MNASLSAIEGLLIIVIKNLDCAQFDSAYKPLDSLF